MCSPVSLQLVAPGEPLATEDPVTDERPLAGVPAQVGPQVGRLAVHLPTALHVADVLFLLCWVAAVPAVYTRVRSELEGVCVFSKSFPDLKQIGRVFFVYTGNFHAQG